MGAGVCRGRKLVHEGDDVHAQQQAEASGASSDKPGKELEDGAKSEVCAGRPQDSVDPKRQQYIDPAPLVHEGVDLHAQQQAEASGASSDKPGKEPEDGAKSEVGAGRPQDCVDPKRQQDIDPAPLVHEGIDLHAQQQAEASGISSDTPGKEPEDGTQSEVGTGRPQDCVDPRRQQYIDPAFLVQILRTKQVRLLRAEFILDWIDGGHGPLPCRQDVPEEGFVNVEAFSEQQLALLTIIAISYTWISKDHPDPNCYHLETLGAMLRCFLSSSFSSAPDRIDMENGGTKKEFLQREGAHFGAADGGCVGVFLDWTGLYQDKPRGRRTPEEQEVFESALKTINVWYAHITTLVWLLTSLPPSAQRKSYHDSGWTTFEACVASILTKGTDMLEITGEARSKMLTSAHGRRDYIQVSHDMMSRQIRIPAMPEEFDRLIDGKVFTNGADAEKIVKPKYSNTFYDLIPSLPAVQFSGLGLTPENAYEVIALASSHVKKLEALDLSFNRDIDLPVQCFAQLPSLTRLDLGFTEVTGDLGALEALVNLKFLSLTSTQVCGDVGELKVLVNLTELCLGETRVCGDVGEMKVLGNLTHLGLSETQVCGDVGELKVLVNLTMLDLHETQVCGDVGELKVLGNLTHLDLHETQVCGDVGEL